MQLQEAVAQVQAAWPWVPMVGEPIECFDKQGAEGGSRRPGTLGELLQRMLTLLSRPDEAAALVRTTGTDPPDPPAQQAGCAGAGAAGGSDSEGGSQGARLGLQLLTGRSGVAATGGTSRKPKGSSGKPKSGKRRLAHGQGADGGPNPKRRCNDTELSQVWQVDCLFSMSACTLLCRVALETAMEQAVFAEPCMLQQGTAEVFCV